jgi:peptidyl-prolyl cis-trans isomerase D
LLGLGHVTPPETPPLAQILPAVRDAYVRRAALLQARAAAQAIADRINRGMPAPAAFAQSGLRLPPTQAVDMRRLDISRTNQQVPPPLLSLFTIPEHRAAILAAPNNAGWFVVVHIARTPGDAATQPQLIATARQQFNTQAGEELAQQFARAIELRSDVRRNEEAIRTERARLTGGASAAE